MYFEEGEDDNSSESSGEYDKDSIGKGGVVYSFGYGYFGQLGLGSGESHSVPRLIKDLNKVLAVACGEAHSIAITEVGEVFTWGCNRYGQLGLGDNNHRSVPTCVDSLKGIKISQAACGTQHTLLLTKNGEVYSFGCGSFGRLGHGDHNHQSLPRIVVAMRGKVVTQISAGGWFSLALSDKGQVFSWGCNRYGQLGLGKIPVQLSPRHITSLYGKSVIKISCGKHHTLVYTDKGEFFSFGAGMCGQLGNKNKKHSFVPVPISDLPKTNIRAIAAGNLHSVILTAAGNVYCWGYISSDQLGLSESGEEYFASPVSVNTPPEVDFNTLFAGGWHNAAISDKGELYTWGFSYKGRLGFGDLEEDIRHPLIPTLVESLTGRVIKSVACGGAHTLIIVTPEDKEK